MRSEKDGYVYGESVWRVLAAGTRAHAGADPQTQDRMAKARVNAPVDIHQAVVADVAGTGVDVIASRSMPEKAG